MEHLLEYERKFRTLNILDDFDRGNMAIKVNYSFPSAKVINMVHRVIGFRGKPEEIRSDNEIEFITKTFGAFS